MNEITIMIADDQPIIRNGLAALLDVEDGFRVVATAADGKEAIDTVSKYQPDVILMDIHMPVMDGLEAIPAIKERHPSTHVIMLTTFTDDEYILRSMQAGATGYILKDMDTEDIIATIHNCLQGRMDFPASIQKKLVKVLNRYDEVTATEFHEQVELEKLDEVPPWESLFSDREKEMIAMLMDGKRNSEIASALFLSEGTVKNYLGVLYRKMNVKGRGQAIAWLHNQRKHSNLGSGQKDKNCH